MIRVRQVKIEVISYSLEKLYDTTLKKLKIPLNINIVYNYKIKFTIKGIK